MTTMDDLFTEYLQSIMPYDRAVKRAVAAHDDLCKDLKADESLGPYIARILLSGSYGRNTATHGIKDVDIIVQLTLTLANIRQMKRSNETEQACVLRLTREAIERTGRTADTKPARRSIYVELTEEINEIGEDLPALTLDIVPVLIPYDKETDPMQIADRELKQWFDTYPNSQLKDSESRNQNSFKIYGYNSYKSLVKMIKAWKKVHFGKNKTPKGFILECMVAQYHNPQAEHWIDAVQNLLQNICYQWPNPDALWDIPTVHDISNQNQRMIPIAKKVEEASRVLNKIHWSLVQINLAKEKATIDLYEAAKIMQLVFGSDSSLDLCFPLPEEENGKTNRVEPVQERGSQHNIREAYPFG
ncbi:MAG: hypothetical protein M1281_20370 [Chloroflexi bacterium]|nr:hypothetical protein [Chloroflexota bacterium]